MGMHTGFQSRCVVPREKIQLSHDYRRNGTALDVKHAAERHLQAFNESRTPGRLDRIATPRVLAIALLLRLLAALLPHSGQATPPSYGDFEAQRHWMSLTTHLPTSEWYFHDSSWWRLDYPPMTAYHSYAVGMLGTWLNPAWFELWTSRGCEAIGLKIFMRGSVLLSEIILFVPAVLVLARMGSKSSGSSSTFRLVVAAFLLQPTIILIDHGHFQYNIVMLGFFLAAVGSFLADLHLLGCVCFVAALGFKQMALFYAPAVAAYLAGTCIFPEIQPFRLLAIAGATVSSFAMLYMPILLGTWRELAEIGASSENIQPFIDQIAQTLHRIFPFSRGLFEDKVANIWCSIHFSGLYKLAIHHSPETLQLAALALTTLLILPPCLIIFLKPRKEMTMLAFTTCAWAFFLASYQVHEKNVLLPLVPMTALLADGKASTRAWVGFANVVGTWSLYHLLIKDRITVAYWPLLGVWLYVMGLPPFTWELYRGCYGPSRLSTTLHLTAYVAIALWHVLACLVAPPAAKPDLWIVANMLCSCAAFCACYAWCLGRLFSESGLAGEASLWVKLLWKRGVNDND